MDRAGGTTTTPGFAQRLERELRQGRLPQASRAVVRAGGARKYHAWLGAAAFADDRPVFDRYCWRLADYEAGGVGELSGFTGELQLAGRASSGESATSPIGLPPREERSAADDDDDDDVSELDDSAQYSQHSDGKC